MTEPDAEVAELPAGIQRLLETTRVVASTQKFAQAVSFKPSPGDICLSSGMKCGTTWLQQIMHGLRSRGDMNFDEIGNVVVYMESDVAGSELFKIQPFQPQMYQNHFPYEICPKGFDKYIVITRDPVDAALSMYSFFCGWFFAEDELSADEFLAYFIAREVPVEQVHLNAVQIRHQASWYPHRKDENVLWLHFEDLKQDLKGCIKLVSDHLGIGVGDQELLDLVEKQASFEFMKKHEKKFDVHQIKQQNNELFGLPKMAGLDGNNVGRVHKGNVNDGKRCLSKKSIASIEAKWRSLVGPVCGYNNYGEMRAGINKELGRSFNHSS